MSEVVLLDGDARPNGPHNLVARHQIALPLDPQNPVFQLDQAAAFETELPKPARAVQVREVLAGLEMGAIAIATLLSQQSGIPAAFIRKAAKPYGTARLAEGSDVADKSVLIVEDVVTSGGQVVLSAGDLRALGARIDTAICVIDREEGGTEALAAAGIRLTPLFRKRDF